MANNSTNVIYDTIAAIITPPGQGGIAGLRIAGSRSHEILRKLVRTSSHASINWEPRFLTFGHALTLSGEFIDEVTAVWLPAPQTYTGLDQAEIFCHGSDLIARQILKVISGYGCRVAEPGEFTRLAFENGRIDLTKAEAIAELIASQTDRATTVAREHLSGAYREHVDSLRGSTISLLAELEAGIDFTENESYGETRDGLIRRADELTERLTSLIATYNEGKLLQQGARVVIAGRPNAGKSSLFNILCKRKRAIVSPIPGTTRDYLTEWIDLGGYPIELIDTAGLRTSIDTVEIAGQQLATELLHSADLILWIVDASEKEPAPPLESVLTSWKEKRIIVALNKVDLGDSGFYGKINLPFSPISCARESGIDQLTEMLISTLGLPDSHSKENLVVTSSRHAEKLDLALAGIESARESLKNGVPPEEIVPSVRNSAREFDELTGRVYTEEVLGAIFGKFCIGK